MTKKDGDSPLNHLIKSLSPERLGAANYMTDRITGVGLFYVYQTTPTTATLTNLSAFIATYTTLESDNVLSLTLKLTQPELITLLQGVFTISISLPEGTEPPALPNGYIFTPTPLTLGEQLDNTYIFDYGNSTSLSSVLNDIVDSVVPHLAPTENTDDTDQNRRDFVKSLTKDSLTWMIYTLYGSALIAQNIKKNIRPQSGIG